MSPDHIDDRKSRLMQIMERLGSAVWQTQMLESMIAHYIVVRLRDSQGAGLERGAELDREVQRKPLGALIRELTEADVLPRDVADEMAQIRDARNWMTHHLCRTERGLIDDKESCARVLKRLEWIADRSLRLNKRPCYAIEKYAEEAGVSPEFIEQESARLLPSWDLDHLL